MNLNQHAVRRIKSIRNCHESYNFKSLKIFGQLFTELTYAYIIRTHLLDV